MTKYRLTIRVKSNGYFSHCINCDDKSTITAHLVKKIVENSPVFFLILTPITLKHHVTDQIYPS